MFAVMKASHAWYSMPGHLAMPSSFSTTLAALAKRWRMASSCIVARGSLSSLGRASGWRGSESLTVIFLRNFDQFEFFERGADALKEPEERWKREPVAGAELEDFQR